MKGGVPFPILTLEEQVAEGGGVAFNSNLNTILKPGVSWPPNGTANLTTAHEQSQNHTFAVERRSHNEFRF